MSQDTLSDVLRTVRLRGATFYYVSGTNDWAAEAPPAQAIAPAVMAGADHVMEYHVVTQGDCWCAIVGEAPVRLSVGDVVMFPHGDGHVMSSAPGRRADPLVSFYYETKIDQLPLRIAYDGVAAPVVNGANLATGNGATRLVCGFIGCDLKPFNPLVATLPRMLRLRPADHGGWVRQVIDQAVDESCARRPGGAALLERMSEMLFVDAVRRYADGLPEESSGWLAGLRDRFVGRALTLLHEKPGAPWTLEDLRRDVGLSRSALHERFVHLVGQPPMQYLAQWRMQVAAGLLRTSQQTVVSIALEVGYDSEAAFARAFKRATGEPPAAWRRARG